MTTPSSTQHTGLSIPFSIAPSEQQQSLRLLELPDDLLELIVASHSQGHRSAGKPLKLQLKSPTRSAEESGEIARRSERAVAENDQLHLCSEDKVWTVRQVSTSNSVYVTLPFEGGPQRSSLQGIEVIAQPSTVLELAPVTYDPVKIERMVRRMVGKQRSRAQIIEDVPAPAAEVDAALDRMAITDQKSCNNGDESGENQLIARLVDGQPLLETWEYIVEASMLTGTKMDQPFKISKIISAIVYRGDYDDIGSRDHMEAEARERRTIQDRIRKDAESLLSRTVPALGVGSYSPATYELTLEPVAVTHYVGWLLLAAQGGPGDSAAGAPLDLDGDMALADFLPKWRQLIPVEGWWKYVTLSTLDGDYVLSGGHSGDTLLDCDHDHNRLGPNEDRIGLNRNATFTPRRRDGTHGPSMKSEEASQLEAAGDASKAPAKRKWHEKFGADRNKVAKK